MQKKRNNHIEIRAHHKHRSISVQRSWVQSHGIVMNLHICELWTLCERKRKKMAANWKEKLNHTASSAINRNSVKIEIHQHILNTDVKQRKKEVGFWPSLQSNKNVKSAKNSNATNNVEKTHTETKIKYREPVFNFPQNYLQYKSELVWTNIIKVFYMNPNICA